MTDHDAGDDGRPGRRATGIVIAGRARSSHLAGRLGTALKEARASRGMRQRDVAARAGVSQPEVAKLESGAGANTRLVTWASCGAAVGLQLAAFFEATAGADLPRDIQHLRRQNLLVAIAARGAWSAAPEALLTNDGWRPRSIDVLLTREARSEAAVVEIWDLLLDGGDAMRGLDAKVLATRVRLGPHWHVQGLLLLRRTSRNQALVRELAPLISARFPARSGVWLRALATADAPMPDAAGFAWTSVDGARLIAARLRA
ncbi:MAG: helix-turn-helix domain-containing protein [Chloroflexi bacterium]|nr:helix-turn-helix domain-containing protein [Chloroflexota bacterium]